MSEKIKEYRTDSLALCPFLMMNDLKYLRAEIALGKHDRPVVSFVFEDRLGVGKDLEIEFMRSDFKRYKDLGFFFRSEIDKLKRQLEKINREESRKTDDKYNGEEV